MFSKIIFTLFTAAVATVLVRGESHTITFINKCGYGTPYLWGPGGALLSTGDAYTSNGPADDLIAYLQIGTQTFSNNPVSLYSSFDAGVCGDNGENCTLIGATLSNDDGSSGYISLIPPYFFPPH
ncbi:uncharacterized protein FIBRA_05169 [Fibroporia radiculosa]|uniref:ML-like domain-containing protein n=1 Tax=Fibroporia radiculosa TaxID=599839 RepID=J4GQI0_9APHY|nr:uncharacterized protein FIBRA_05169 [Fibroporia radiculosa]CCM03050.1 predicted protein [Fibroporia radiculosa]